MSHTVSTRRPSRLYFGLAGLLLASACGSAPPEVAGPDPAIAPPDGSGAAAAPQRERYETTLDKVGLDGGALDKSADACQDFYQFACGGWIKKTEIPADKSRWVRSFSVIDERNEADLKQILEKAALAKDGDPAQKKLGDYYGACMDETAVDKAGIKPVLGLIAQAKRVRDDKSLTALVAELHKHKVWALFDVSSEQDFKDATRYLAYFDQNGLGLPDRDYYTKDDDKSKQIRDKYLSHVEAMFKLGGYPAAAAKSAASDVMKIETELAKVSKTRVERRDPQGLYNKIKQPDLKSLSPKIDWELYLKALGLSDIEELNVTSKPFFDGMSKALEASKLPELRNYFVWQILHDTARALSKPFQDEAFKLEQVLTGQKEERARWKRCIDSTDAVLGELLAQPFIELRFAGESKSAAEKLIHAIGESFQSDLKQLDWMDTAARELAKDKFTAMAYLIGFPDKWKSYDFDVKRGDYAGNALRGRAFDLKRNLKRLGKPVDRGEWEMTPPTVNAYYNPLKNQMVFPAGILQPPFYDVKAAVPVNLGAMGMVVGHELTHGFDDEGSQFDKNGNLKEWWSAALKQKFKAKTGCVADQYSEFEVLPGLKVNGKLTLGENIADMGGVKLAFHAYRALTKDTKEGIADGFSEDQQFFLSVGQAWCAKQREEATRMLVAIDPHSPPKWRVNGSLRNLPEFAQAFSCQKATPMNPERACGVW